jgi:hypothetical protein
MAYSLGGFYFYYFLFAVTLNEGIFFVLTFLDFCWQLFWSGDGFRWGWPALGPPSGSLMKRPWFCFSAKELVYQSSRNRYLIPRQGVVCLELFLEWLLRWLDALEIRKSTGCSNIKESHLPNSLFPPLLYILFLVFWWYSGLCAW